MYVDGGNLAPVEVGSLSHDLQGFLHPRRWRISAIHSITFKCFMFKIYPGIVNVMVCLWVPVKQMIELITEVFTYPVL